MIARARFSASPGSANSVELSVNMPLPTKTAAAPDCITKLASVGVAIPPALKFGTSSRPTQAQLLA